ncbi:MAG: bifunctional riboflavin kinase/FAD synthetase [Gammaproteobacteria bacterium]|nr:MAG: bifunctional riboflavin kinase/FAD synthetase [Gammaproteobacteria bacterium]
MLLIRGQHNLRETHRGCVATIGNFDGVHLGHQAVFEALKRRADEYGLPSLVITFEPQPLEYFRPLEAPPRLMRVREKLEFIERAGIDRVLLLRFDQDLALMPAEDFIREYLVEALGVRHLYVGDDFRFGYQRRGDFQLLCSLGGQWSFEVESLQTVSDDCGRISSTRIREALAVGDLATARCCLGRDFSISGRVSHGHKRGRTIGFPTMNVGLARRRSPIRGVYAVEVDGLGELPYPGVANVGNRPTLEGDDRYLLEVHLFDFDREVYGEQVRVRFIEHIREEKKFESFDALRTQILRDAEQARAALARGASQCITHQATS